MKNKDFKTIIRCLNVINKPYYDNDNIVLYNADCIKLLNEIPNNSINVIFSDPPYKLSNNGITCHNGKMTTVNKGKWDISKGFENDLKFHDLWIGECKRILKDDGTIWISGTYHSIYQCGYLLQKHNFHILNDIIWFKPNASPNLSCRFFTASHETLIWARKNKNTPHYFNYEEMKNGLFPEDKLKNENKQMRSVWSIPYPSQNEKKCGNHPTQKPLRLLERIIVSSTKEGDIVLDPFNGSGTTGVVVKKCKNRFYIGIESMVNYCKISRQRLYSLDH
jgi:site-specific DNA-methyltransferase (adenine-specific)